MKQRNYWTKEKCIEIAKLFKTRKEFRNKYGGAYAASFKNNWLDEVCSNMEECRKPKGFWNNRLVLGCS
jgi:hypothetical protein